ncbi:MAG: tyrosine-protein phosphatase [Anaerolineae bacterium]
MTEQAWLSERRLDWPACYNVRDLGGLPTAGGGLSATAAIVRSDYCARLNADGWRALVNYGVRTIIDLRSVWELDKEPYAVPPFAVAAGVVYLSLPLVSADPELDNALSDPANAGRDYAIVAERCASNIAAILRAIINAQPGGIVIHCQAGKDRTGIIVALLLRLAGVPDATIMADYVESEPRLWPVWDAMVAAAAAIGTEPDYSMKPLAFPSVFQNLLDQLDGQYGGVEGYLAHIGLSPDEVRALAHRLPQCTASGADHGR